MIELKLEQSLVDNRYEIVDRLSRGSYAEIFRARDRQDGGHEVVIKALNPSLQGTPDVDLERTLIENFQNEAIALDTVRHPHVILRLGHGTAADLRGTPFHYLVLEYMPGGDLLKLCRNRPGNALSLDEALFFFRQVCEGLAYAHSRGIIHRDLKPNNFLLSADHRVVKIADFGVAKITAAGGGEDAEVTRVGAQLYAPPEHHPERVGDRTEQGDPLTAAADIYSLAKSFYTVVVGRPPGLFKCAPITALPESLRAQPWGAALGRVLRKATDDRPGERHGSVIEFWSDLAQVAGAVERDDEQTLVRPRLVVSPGALPERPARPEFESTLAVEGAIPALTTEVVDQSPNLAVPNLAGPNLPEPGPVRPLRVVIDLPGPAADGAGRLPAEPRARSVKPERAARRAARSSKTARRAASATLAGQSEVERNRALLRRRFSMMVLVVVLLAGLGGVYQLVGSYTGNRRAPIGFGPPTEIEVITPALNVRNGPSMQDRPMGVVLKGSRHRVITNTAQGWMQIEVSQWDEATPHDQSGAVVQGWIYADSDYVRTVSRRFW